jgi:hypothetical protein
MKRGGRKYKTAVFVISAPDLPDPPIIDRADPRPLYIRL